MKRIVICCDGTWNRLDADRPTNVARIAKAILPRAPDGIVQVIRHIDGVGTGRGVGPVSQAADRALGGLFGRGLMATLAEAYRFLIFNYAPGDEIHLFGFSRGAFTARTLSGLIRNCAIPQARHAGEINAALDLYRRRSAGTHPDADAACAFRARVAPHIGVGEADRSWRAARGLAPGHPLRLRYVGVWDTVGALGVPSHLATLQWLNRGLRFHDTRLSRGVEAARQAVAIDERRRVFPPALWDNLDTLNAETEGPAKREQRWFPGDHGAVGGGGEPRLSNDALLWVAEGAMAEGLALDPDCLAEWRRDRDCLAPLQMARGPLAAFLNLSRRDRSGPDRIDDLAAAALARWRADPRWRPGALRRVRHLLGGDASAPRQDWRTATDALGDPA